MNIAYMLGGQGLEVVVMPFHYAHVRRWWTMPGGRSWSSLLAARHRVASYDSRGQGLSTRNLEKPPTMEDYRLDLETVLEAVGFERPVLVAYGGFAHIAIRFAAERPERVSALVLICCCESFATWPLTGMLALAEENWDLLVELMNAKRPETSRPGYAEYMNACAEPREFAGLVRAFSTSNVSDVLPALKTPTLVVHALDQHWLSVEEGAKFAARIDGARLEYIDGDSEPNPVLGVHAIESFIAGLGLDRASAGVTARRGTVRPTFTKRQSQVLQSLVAGRTNREIADDMVISERTVERHIADLYSKLRVRNRAEAVAVVLRWDDR